MISDAEDAEWRAKALIKQILKTAGITAVLLVSSEGSCIALGGEATAKLFEKTVAHLATVVGQLKQTFRFRNPRFISMTDAQGINRLILFGKDFYAALFLNELAFPDQVISKLSPLVAKTALAA